MVDRSKLTFREAEGKPRFPPILSWGQIDQRIRAGLWNIFHPFLEKNLDSSNYKYVFSARLRAILYRNHVDRMHGYVDQFKSEFSHLYEHAAFFDHWSKFFKEADYLELFDFISFLVRDRDCPADLANAIAQSLNKPYSPYRLVKNPPTIMPVVNEEHAATLQNDVQRVFDSSFAGAKTHLQAGLDAFGNNDHRAVVRESIQAVESAVRDFTKDPTAILSKALKQLGKSNQIHPALSDAFDKLYAYSSDEKGIRHALVFGENEKVGFDEAIFFLSACSAFVAFLWSKAKAE